MHASMAFSSPVPAGRRWYDYIGTVAGIVLLVVALIALQHVLRGFHWYTIIRQAETMAWWQFVVALVCTAASYLILTAYDVLGFHYIRHPISYARVAFASFIGYAFSNTVGLSLVSGGSVRYRLYSAWGLSAAEITKVLAFCSYTFIVGTVAITGAIFAWEPLPVRVLGLSPFAVRLVGVVLLGVLAAYLVGTAVRRRPLRMLGWHVRLPGLRMSALQIVVCAVDLVLAGSVLYALLPPAAHVPYFGFIGIFLVANVLGHVSQVPGGLGVFESTMIVLLRGELPTSTMVGALLLYRVIYHLLPLLLGMVLLLGHEASAHRAPAGSDVRTVRGWSASVVAQLLSLTAFIAGAVLLFSGAVPPSQARLLLLRGIVGLPVIELANVLASGVGMALIMCSFALERRLAQAYHIVLALLGIGMTLSVLRGLHHQQALVLLVAAATLVLSRHSFRRRASVLSGRVSSEQVVMVSIAVLTFLFIGYLSFRSVEYSHWLWWKVGIGADASRYLRAVLAAAVVGIALSVARWRRVRQEIPGLPDAADIARLRGAVRHGGAQAQLALCGDKHILWGTGDAFVMFEVGPGFAVALGDPVAPNDEECAEMVWAFRQLCDDNGLVPVFYQASHARTKDYHDVGLAMLALGEDAVVDPSSLTREQDSLAPLREQQERLRMQGVLWRCDERPVAAHRLASLLALRDPDARATGRGFAFGQLTEDYLGRVSLVTAEHDGRVVGYVTLLESADAREAEVDLLRGDAAFGHELIAALLLEALLLAKRRGMRRCSLGLTPLPAGTAQEGGPVWSRIASVLYGHGEEVLALRGQRREKELFQPRWETKYLASPGGIQLPRILLEIARIIRRPPHASVRHPVVGSAS